MGFIKTIVKGNRRKLMSINDKMYYIFASDSYTNFYIDLYSHESGKILTLYHHSDFEGFLQSIFKIEDLKNKKNDK